MSVKRIPIVVLHHPEQEFKYQEICDALNRTFLDVLTVATESPRDKNTPFYCIVFTKDELLHCLYHSKKAVPIGYKLLLRYIESTKKQSDTKPHTLQYLMNITQNLFQKLTICTSGIHNDAKNEIKTVCNVLSASFDGNFTDSITHLIEANIGSQKHGAAVSSNGRCKIVTPQWIYDSYINGKIMTESMYCPPLFCGFFISVTGIESTQRESIKAFVKQYGGEYCQGLSQQCTHLIANEFNNNEKCTAAVKWKIPILSTKWFYDHLKSKGCVDIKDYILNCVSQQPTTMDIDNDHKNDNEDDIDIGEDTELREVIQMIHDHDNKDINTVDSHILPRTETEIIDEDEYIDDLCYLEDCVVLLLCLESDVRKEAIELLRRGKGTALSMYHSMGTHVITSNLDGIKKEYSQCFDHCNVLSIDWLRHCDDAQSVVDCNEYNLLIHDSTMTSTKTITSTKTMSQTSIATKNDYNEDEMDEYEQYIEDCLNMDISHIVNDIVFQDITFNINKVSLNEQRKVSTLITAGNGVIVGGGKGATYLVCCVISSLEFESNTLEGMECVSMIWIAECLRRGQLLNVTQSISFLPEILSTQQTNSLFQDLNVCLSQFDNKLFERYRIRSLLSDTNAIYHGSFHPQRCDILICKLCKGSKYESAKQRNIPIVHYLWLIDSIKNGKQMQYKDYALCIKSKRKPVPKPTQVQKRNENTANTNKNTEKEIKQHRKRSSILGDVFGENLQNALTNFRIDDDLCSPALASTMPPQTEIKEDDAHNDDVIQIESDYNPMNDITNYSTQKSREEEKEKEKVRGPIMEGIEHLSPIPKQNTQNNDNDIVIYCHRSVDKNKKKLIDNLVGNHGLNKAKTLNKKVTHYIIDTELTDNTKEMKDAKVRERNGLLQIVNSKWLDLKLKEFRNMYKNDENHYENSITRARKRKYKDLEFTDSNYFGEESVSDDIDQFENDKDILSAMNKESKRKRKKRKTNHKNKENNCDIRKHITIKHKIGVLLTGINGDKRAKYEEMIRNLNGMVLNEDNYAQIDDEENDEVNFKYVVAPKLVRSEKIIIGIIRQKIIVKPSFLDSCKKAKRWLSHEPHSWMNDDELIKYIPSNGAEFNTNNEDLKSKVDLIQAIRMWRNIDVMNTCFSGKNVFIWLPQKRISTYWRILECNKAHLYTINDDENIEKQCQDIADKVKIDDVFLANHDEIKQTAKEMYKNSDNKSKYQSTYKLMRKRLTMIAKFWSSKQNIKCYDSDYILDWTLEGLVFSNSDVKKKDYLFS